MINPEEIWTCDRCKHPKSQNIQCHLCPLRGGALKKAYLVPSKKASKRADNGSAVTNGDDLHAAEEGLEKSDAEVLRLIRKEQLEEAARVKADAIEVQLAYFDKAVRDSDKEFKHNKKEAKKNNTGPPEPFVFNDVKIPETLKPEPHTITSTNGKKSGKIDAVWVHSTCALLVPSAKFLDIDRKGPIAVLDNRAHRKSEFVSNSILGYQCE